MVFWTQTEKLGGLVLLDFHSIWLNEEHADLVILLADKYATKEELLPKSTEF